MKARVYSIDDFAAIPSAKELVTATINVDQLPTIEDVKVKARWTDDMIELFDTSSGDIEQLKDSTGFDRSSALARLAYEGAEQQWDNEQILAVLLDADTRWGKYVGRRDRENRYLIPMIDRAREKVGYDGLLDGLDIRKLVDGTGKGSASAEFAEKPEVWGWQEFVDADFPIDWMLEGLLAKQGIGIITGYPGTGKTQLCIQLGAELALGHDKFLRWHNTNGSRKVFFLSLEMGENSLHQFMSTMSPSYDDRRMLTKNFKVRPHGEALHLDKAAGQNYLTALLEEYQPDVLIIDSLQKSISKEMTDELATKALMEYLAKLRKKYRCSMVFVHHMRKAPNEAAKKKEIELSDMYGSTFIAAEVDFVLALRRETKNVLEVSPIKMRLGPLEDPFEIWRDEHLHFSIDLENIANQFAEEDRDDQDNRRSRAGFGL